MHSSGFCPRLGSLCRVRVRLKADGDKTESPEAENGNLSVPPARAVSELTDEVITTFTRCLDSVLQVPLGDWITLKLGEGQCDVTEACVEGMRAGEECEILLTAVEKGSDDPVAPPAEERRPLYATVELHTFTPGKDWWELSPGDKWEWVRAHKERGGVRFRSGDVWGAADSYSRALKLLITLNRQSREASAKGQESEEQKEAKSCDEGQQLHTDSVSPSAKECKTFKAELHSNLSLCQLKLNLPQRAKASAAKATSLEPSGAKAWYRLGQACQMVNELEEARHAFRKLLQLQPDSPAALKALKDVANKEKETNAQLGMRLSKMFS
ncbi:FK506-binding protein-like isoform X2 [Genypterus blacodes]|uniref:FK506-binding protein-like isoform X2 n=1 Tax=Genypterus blacodes TaxID=154954 RepID=UPI003F75843A